MRGNEGRGKGRLGRQGRKKKGVAGGDGNRQSVLTYPTALRNSIIAQVDFTYITHK